MESAIREELEKRRRRAKRKERFKLFITGISLVLFTLAVVIFYCWCE
jgi:cell division septal protein FtsQ